MAGDIYFLMNLRPRQCRSDVEGWRRGKILLLERLRVRSFFDVLVVFWKTTSTFYVVHGTGHRYYRLWRDEGEGKYYITWKTTSPFFLLCTTVVVFWKTTSTFYVVHGTGHRYYRLWRDEGEGKYYITWKTPCSFFIVLRTMYCY